jgi:putative heme-binding domain-containing protein
MARSDCNVACRLTVVVCLLHLSASAAAPASKPAPATRPGPKKDAYVNFAMTHQGDAARGASLFADESRLACSRCHAVDGKGGRAGPDLFAIGDKFGRRDLIDSILSPSATIAVGYSTMIVETRSGDVHDGVVKEAEGGGVSLMGIDGKIVRIDSGNILRQRTTDVSMMPEGLHAGLTPQEFADLVEYLARLRLPDSATASHRGQPDVIPQLAAPIAFKPFHSDEQKFAHPVWFGPVPGVANHFAVVEHETGKVLLVDKDPSRDKTDTKSIFVETGKFLPGTRGLLGMVFHPQYATNRRYFLAKHVVEDGRFATYVLEGEAAPDLKHDSGRPLRPVLKSEAATNVHYGGSLEFGPDGLLYVGMGDTGPQQDPQGHGQNMALLRGKIMRIDVDHPAEGKPYAVPADNPLVGRQNVRPEIWAYGFREPWRFSFDPATGDLWVGDVGQDLYEEVDLARRGENYGWNVYEGFAPFSNRYRREGESYVPPVFAYSRRHGVSVTGGYVYRADPQSSFHGVYVFADYESKRVFGLTQKDRVLEKVRQIGTAPQRAVSFGRDARGELYVVGYEGTIYRIDFAGARFE